MNPITHSQSFFPFQYGNFSESTSFQAEQTRAGFISQSQSTDLTITTDEGDTVTLSLALATEINAGLHRSASYENGRAESTQTAFLEFSDSQSLSVEIDGNLSAEEQEDIRAAIEVIGGMIDDFLSGDLQEMAAGGELLKELDTVASLEAAFSYERQVKYGEQQRVEISQSALEENRGNHRRGHGRLQRLMQRIDKVTDDMADQVREFRGRRDHLAGSIRNLFNHYRNDEMENAPESRLRQEVVQTMQSAFVQKIQTLTESASFELSYTA
ncbi:hypothetical protein DSCW_45540 [Desulfosarcina widdelii]|uniref:DUF5610 domain-containing protein n=1 Tax=Desulfosarcina widdelii TaxID=947919 RepID=A0A5K7ZM47_9BACT|nr:hypothetical protein [Desulfosarcina widdelii]BBO77137.1 hypothetical protein DSCW_45540 [Desulfosarcina widdelii]